MKDKQGEILTFDEFINKSVFRLYSIMADFGLMLINIVGAVPLHHFRRFIYRLAGAQIGRGSSIHCGARFFSLKKIIIGEDCVIGFRVFIDGREKVIIGSHVNLASEVMIYNSAHDIDDKSFAAYEKPVVIEDYVFIGPRAIIMPPVKIVKGAVVAAGAVVTKDVEPMSVVAGIPAREIKKRQIPELKYKIGRARWFQ